MKKSFCFILNPLELIGNAPIEIIPDHWLQKADSEQTDLIRHNLIQRYAHVMPLPAYEYTWLEQTKDSKGNTSRSSQELPAEQWRYWIVAFDGPNKQTQDLRMATNLLKNDLDLGPEFVYWNEENGPGIISHGSYSSFFEFNSYLFGDGSLKITSDEIAWVTCCFNSIKTCEKEQTSIYQTVKDFFQLKSLPRRSHMIVLGYFSVIEALITHDPKDDFDSLNHQISTKMVLLSKRFERHLNYDGHFGPMDREAIWKKLYGYRSAIAHGTPADFKNKFSSLRDSGNALEFLKEAAKLTLLYAMKEPEFLADLKKC